MPISLALNLFESIIHYPIKMGKSERALFSIDIFHKK